MSSIIQSIPQSVKNITYYLGNAIFIGEVLNSISKHSTGELMSNLLIPFELGFIGSGLAYYNQINNNSILNPVFIKVSKTLQNTASKVVTSDVVKNGHNQFIDKVDSAALTKVFFNETLLTLWKNEKSPGSSLTKFKDEQSSNFSKQSNEGVSKQSDKFMVTAISKTAELLVKNVLTWDALLSALKLSAYAANPVFGTTVDIGSVIVRDTVQYLMNEEQYSIKNYTTKILGSLAFEIVLSKFGLNKIDSAGAFLKAAGIGIVASIAEDYVAHLVNNIFEHKPGVGIKANDISNQYLISSYTNNTNHTDQSNEYTDSTYSIRINSNEDLDEIVMTNTPYSVNFESALNAEYNNICADAIH